MNNLIDRIPQILDSSRNLFSLFALIVIVVGILSFFFYLKSDRAEKNRAFLFVLLFFFGVVIAALFTGTLSGFQQGSEATTEQVSQNPGSVDPLLVKLSPAAISQLETHIQDQGEEITSENKTKVLEEALENYTNPPEPPNPPTLTPRQPPESASGDADVQSADFQSTVADFSFALEGCYRSGQHVDCKMKITNQGADRRRMILFADGTRESATFDGDTRYLAYESRLADRRHPRQVVLEMPFDIGINAQLFFSPPPDTVSVLQAVEIWISADNRYYAVKFEDVPIDTEG